ncbi:hypothetical protein [Massilia sp. DWR3-1-1]|uniref:hypothetical protein n=1 Tax=Massilia sp. DWR3-1-1 TaxID=2804559 RepID=UPI003CE9CC87
MDINELPDLSDWRFVEVWTVEEAAMLWAAIDPWDHETRRLNELRGIVRIMQYKKAGTYQRAIAEAVCAGTLPFVKAWELHEDYQNGSWAKEVSFPDLPDSNTIIHHMTRISQAAFMKWVKSKNIPSYREFVIRSQQKPVDGTVTIVAVDDGENTAASEVQLLLPPASYLDPNHPRYTVKLKAAIQAWETVTEPPPGRTAKQALEQWLTDNAADLELTHPDGKAMTDAIREIAKIANWQLKGGPPKTPG